MNKELWDKLPKHISNPNPDIYLSENYGVLDYETTNLDKGSFHNEENHIVSAAIYDNPSGRSHVYIGNEFELGEILHRTLHGYDYWVAHNANFELGWSARVGIALGDSVTACTQIAEYTLAGNRAWGKLQSLDNCLARRGMQGKGAGVSRLIKAGVSPADIPEAWLKKYNVRDVEIENALWRHQRAQLQEEGLLPVFFTKNLSTPILVDLEHYGFHLDKDRVEAVFEQQSFKLRELEVEWDEMTGGVNAKSGKQLRELFYDILGFSVPRGAYTATGAAKTDAATLSKLEPETYEQRRIIDLVRNITKIRDNMSKILSKFHDCVRDSDGLLRFKINQTITATHRLSSTGQKYKTQGQNIHRSFKPLICARHDGWDIGEIDQDGLEFRAAGHLGRDANVKEDINNGVDPHEKTGKIIYKDQWNFSESSKSNHNKPYRQDAKAYTFKPLYGGKKGTPAEVEYYEEFRKTYNGIAQRQERWVDEVIAKGYLVNETGLRFYWPNTVRFGNGAASNFQAICNYPVQYFATGDSGIVSIAVIYQWHLMKAANMKSFICNTIHDSSIGEIAPNEKELYRDIAEWAFTEGVDRYLKKVYDIELFIPVSAKVEYHKYWNDSEDWRKEWLLEKYD